MKPLEKKAGRFHVFFYSTPVEIEGLQRAFAQAQLKSGEGRAGIRIAKIDNTTIAIRKYVHGGLLRGVTRDLFFIKRRVLREASILHHLLASGFPTVAPFCALIEKRLFFARLYLATVFVENKGNLLEYLKKANHKQRLRAAKSLASLFWRMEQTGVYHPDFHLRNVLVKSDGGLLFLDFDRAYITVISEQHTETVFRRLDRFVEKMRNQNQLDIEVMAKAVFLRTYERLSGREMLQRMQSGAAGQNLRRKLGWRIGSLLYGQKEDGIISGPSLEKR
jgi:tRNA A-37 threonylcarbamoyl transferase component Bud32